MNANTHTPAHYTRTAIALHWALAAALLANFVLGVSMHELPFSMTRLKLYNWHKWAGILILGASGLRLLWRLRHRPPADLPMPLGLTPRNQDGEVAGFELLPVADALACASGSGMTVDAALVTLDFALRHGLMKAPAGTDALFAPA